MPVPTPPVLDVPPLVRQRAVANGAPGRRWLDELDEVVAELARRWDLEVGQSLRGGTASFVALATDGAGRERVLKVAMPPEIGGTDAFGRAVTVHRLAEGRGCALLLAEDASVPAMLLERLGPNLDDLGMPLERKLEVIATTLRGFWRPVDATHGLPTGAEKAAWLARYIVSTWEELDRPCPSAVIDRAVACCDERATAFDPDDSVLVHGDAHGWNTLDAGDGAFKFVDPEGLRSDRAHDLSVAMREYNLPLLKGDTARLVCERAELLASLCGVETEAVWQWGFIERVSTGLVNLRELGGAESGAFLEVATRCC